MTDRVPAALLSTKLFSGESDVSEDSVGFVAASVPDLVDLACNTTFDLSADEHIRHAPIQALHALLRLGKKVAAPLAAPRLVSRTLQTRSSEYDDSVDSLEKALINALIEFAPFTIPHLRSGLLSLSSGAFLALHNSDVAHPIACALVCAALESRDVELCREVARNGTLVCEQLLALCDTHGSSSALWGNAAWALNAVAEELSHLVPLCESTELPRMRVLYRRLCNHKAWEGKPVHMAPIMWADLLDGCGLPVSPADPLVVDTRGSPTPKDIAAMWSVRHGDAPLARSPLRRGARLCHAP